MESCSVKSDESFADGFVRQLCMAVYFKCIYSINKLGGGHFS